MFSICRLLGHIARGARKDRTKGREEKLKTLATGQVNAELNEIWDSNGSDGEKEKGNRR